MKFIVSTVCISIAYLFLSLSAQINWIVIIVVVSIVVIVLIIYSSYQIVGLYYGLFFKGDRTLNDKTQAKEINTDKESASRL